MIFDWLFSVAMFAVSRYIPEAYASVWSWLQPFELMLLGAAILEMLELANALGFALLGMTVAIGMGMASAETFSRQLIAGSAMICFMGASAAAIRRRGPVMMIYLTGQLVQHMAILWLARRWRPGAYAQVVSVLCYTSWIFQGKDGRKMVQKCL